MPDSGGPVYVSHAYRNVTYAGGVAEYLRGQGLAVWLDERPDEQWDDLLGERVDQCRAVVVLTSPAARESARVRGDLQRARARRRPIFPISFDGDPVVALGLYQHESVVGGRSPTRALVQYLRDLPADADPVPVPRADEPLSSRAWAVAAVSDWLRAAEAPGRVLVVAGRPGSGKSAVLAGAVRQAGVDILAFDARDAVVADWLIAVARWYGLPPPEVAATLIGQLRDTAAAGPVRVVVDSLDSMATEGAREHMLDALVELAALPHARVVVAVRGFAISRAAAATTVDLDADGGNDLTEGLIPDRPGATVGEALEAHLGRAPAGRCGLLTALAYARGQGIDDRHWLAFAHRLGVPATAADLDAARTDPLVETSSVDGEPVTRLRHPAVADELRGSRDRRADERALLDAVRPDPAADAYARRYAADHAGAAGALSDLVADPGYATVADLDRLLAWLPASDDALLRATIDLARPLPPDRRRRLFALASAHLGLAMPAVVAADPRPRWAHRVNAPHRRLTGHLDAVWALAVGRVGDRAVIVSGGDDGRVRRWDARTGRGIGVPLRAGGQVRRLALGRVGDRDVVVAGGAEGRLGLWDARTGQPGPELTGLSRMVRAVALARVGGREVVAARGDNGWVVLWDTDTGEPVDPPAPAVDGPVWTIGFGRVGDSDIVISSADDTLRMWDLDTGEPVGGPMPHSFVNDVATGRAGERDVMVSVGTDYSLQPPYRLRIWDARTGEPQGEPLAGHTDEIRGVALGHLNGRDVIATAGADRTVRLWDAHTAQAIGAPLTGHLNSWAIGVAVGPDAIVSSGGDTTVRIWDAGPGPTRTGHNGPVLAVAAGRAGDRDLVVSIGHDRTVRWWDAATGDPVGAPLNGHEGWPVDALAVGRFGGRDVVVTGGRDYQARLWDLGTGEPVAAPLDHPGHVAAVAVGHVGDRDLVVTGGDDHQLWIWDLRSGERLKAARGHTRRVLAVACGSIGLAVSGSSDATVRAWDARSGEGVGAPMIGHMGPVRAVAIGRAAGVDLVASGGEDSTVRLWDPHTGQPVGEPLTGHAGHVRAVAFGRMNGRDVVLSGADDATIRWWDALTGSVIAVQDCLAPVHALTLAPGMLAVATGPAVAVLALDISPQ